MEMKNNGYDLYSPGSSGWTSLRNPEFQEADIWEVFQEKVPDSGATISFDQDPSFTSKLLAITSTRTIPKPNRTSNYSRGPGITQHSAPVNIPDWSKIYGSSSKNITSRNSFSWLSPDSEVHHLNHHGWESKGEYEEEEEEKGNNVIPPHEWIARKVSRSETFSFSVCEGAGRTLKGRDLSRVRNAVLTKTGFLEPNSRLCVELKPRPATSVLLLSTGAAVEFAILLIGLKRCTKDVEKVIMLCGVPFSDDHRFFEVAIRCKARMPYESPAL